MDYFIYIDTISKELSILYFKGWLVKISVKWHVFVDEDCFILANSAECDEANSAEADEMPPCVPFHQVLHYLPKYMHLVTRIQNKKGSRNISIKILYLLLFFKFPSTGSPVIRASK